MTTWDLEPELPLVEWRSLCAAVGYLWLGSPHPGDLDIVSCGRCARCGSALRAEARYAHPRGGEHRLFFYCPVCRRGIDV